MTRWLCRILLLAGILSSAAAAKAAAQPHLTALTLNPSAVVGGKPSTGRVTLSGPAPPLGVEIRLSSAHPTIAVVPESVTVPSSQTSATFEITTKPLARNPNVMPPSVDVVITATQLRKLRPPSIKSAPLTVAVAYVTLVFVAGPVDGGDGTFGIVKLTGPAPADGAVVHLSSDNTALVTVPASVTVPAGSEAVGFNLATLGVPAATSVGISGGRTVFDRKQTSLLLKPAEMNRIEVVPFTITGGMPGHGRVFLTGRVPDGTVAAVSMSSSGPAATVPQSVTVQGGQYWAPFSVATIPVAAPTTVTLTGSYGGLADTYDVIVQPPSLEKLTVTPGTVTSGTSAIGKVRLTAPAPQGGAIVNLYSSNTAAATVPPTVTVLHLETVRTFNVPTHPVPQTTEVTLTAVFNGSDTDKLTLLPLKPDLTIQSLKYYDTEGNEIPSALAGQFYRMCANVVNAGPVQAGANKLWIRMGWPEATPTGEATWIQEKNVPVLAAGAGASVCAFGPSSLIKGTTVSFDVRVDFYEVVAESNESNNRIQG